jgi:hypothetical protein
MWLSIFFTLILILTVGNTVGILQNAKKLLDNISIASYFKLSGIPSIIFSIHALLSPFGMYVITGGIYGDTARQELAWVLTM